MNRDSFAYFALTKGANIPARCEGLERWSQARVQQETWSFCKTLVQRDGVRARYRDWGGRERDGFNFASQDYISA